MRLPNDWIRFIESLNASNVEYVVVGAHALAYHGLPRLTGDLDIFVRGTLENARRLAKALDLFAPGGCSFDPKDLAEPNRMLTLGHVPMRIDILNEISGVDFESAWNSKALARVDGHEMWVISRELLIQNKLATGRQRDAADVADLLGGEPA